MEELMFPEVSEASVPLLTSCFIHELGDFGNRAMRTCIIFNPYGGGTSEPLFRKKYPQVRKNLLSARELEVLACFAKGMSTEETSRHLHVSSNTIKTHRKNILFKLDAKNTTEALKISLSENML
jgi:DNA-binding CsgD family transcriptional regulator